MVIRVPYWKMSSYSFLFTLSSLDHRLFHAFLSPRLSHLTLMTSRCAVSRSLEASPCISILSFSCNVHLRGARSSKGSTWGHSLAGGGCIPQHTELLLDKSRIVIENPSQHTDQHSLKIGFDFFYLIIPMHIKPSWRWSERWKNSCGSRDSEVPILSHVNQDWTQSGRLETINMRIHSWGQPDRPQNDDMGRKEICTKQWLAEKLRAWEWDLRGRA